MTTPTEEYQSKLRTVTQILDLIQPHDTIVAGCTGDEPVEVLRELHTIHDQVSDIKVLLFGLPEPYEFAMNPKYSDVFYTASSFSDRSTCAAHEGRSMHFVPSHGHDATDTTRRLRVEHPDWYIGRASLPDRNGYVSLGVCGDNFALAHRAKHIIIGVDPTIPHTTGYTELNVGDIDYLYEAEERPSQTYVHRESTEEELTIGRSVASLIEDGSTIQLGVGKVPNAVAHFLDDKNDLGLHSEMIPPSLFPLIKSGVINGSAKTFLPYKNFRCKADTQPTGNQSQCCVYIGTGNRR